MISIRSIFGNEKMHFNELSRGKDNGLRLKRNCAYKIIIGSTPYTVNEFVVIESKYATYNGQYLTKDDCVYITNDMLDALLTYTDFGETLVFDEHEK